MKYLFWLTLNHDPPNFNLPVARTTGVGSRDLAPLHSLLHTFYQQG
jgi:hypothetical protein